MDSNYQYLPNQYTRQITANGVTVTEGWSKALSLIQQEDGTVTQRGYWLGWISPQNTPEILQHTNIYYNIDEDVLRFSIDTIEENHPCGYIKLAGAAGGDFTSRYLLNDTAEVNYNQYRSDNYFLNDLHPEYSAYTCTLTLTLMCVIKINEEVAAKNSQNPMFPTVSLNYGLNSDTNGNLKNYLDFLSGERSETISLVYANNTYSFSLNTGDFEDGYAELVSNEDSSVSALIAIVHVTMPKVYTPDSNTTLDTSFCIQARYMDNGDEQIYSARIADGAYIVNFPHMATLSRDSSIGIDYGDVEFTSPGRIGGLVGDFKYSDCIDLSTTIGYLVNGHVIATAYFGSGGGGTRTVFYHIYTPNELYRMIALMYRVRVSGARWAEYSYINGVTYATDVSESDEFLARLKTGDITDPDFKSGLRPWQYDNISVNAFKEDDVPPYEPEPPEDDEEIGDPIVRPGALGVGGTNGFITQYSMTAAQVGQLGQLLWTSFTDPDYWRNFMFSLALDTGSFNMSSMLDYFISLRVYPFPLINVPSHAPAGNNMYIGAGNTGLSFTNALHTINNYADYINAGSVTVPRHYGDFRDYNNVEIMLYLPYCGTVQLNPGDVVGNTLSCQYAIDFATGGCIAYVDMSTGEGSGYPIAALPGSIGADVPLTATNAGQITARFAGDVINLAALIGGSAQQDLSNRVGGAASALLGNPVGVGAALGGMATQPIHTAAGASELALQAATRPAIAMPMLAGGRGFGAFGAPQAPYIQIRRGIYKQPSNYAKTEGMPSTSATVIGSHTGLIQALIDVNQVPCTAPEAEEIRSIALSGIIV